VNHEISQRGQREAEVELTLHDDLLRSPVSSPNLAGGDDTRMNEMGREGQLFSWIGRRVEPARQHRQSQDARCDSPSNLNRLDGEQYLGQSVHPLFVVVDMLGSSEGDDGDVGQVNLGRGVRGHEVDLGRLVLRMGRGVLVMLMFDESKVDVEVLDGCSVG
jgi:hypothetical protein